MDAMLRGTFTALVTPFAADESIDFAAFESLIDDQIAAGVEGILVLGTTGESPTVNGPEFAEIVRVAIGRAASRAKILVGVGTNDTARTLQQAHVAAALGADALLVVCPYYSKPTQGGLFEHFSAVADAVPVPQIVYNIQGRTGVNIATDTLVRLARHANIVGVKEASDDIDQIMDVIDGSPADFAVLSGSDHLTLPLLSLGGDGVISTLANLVPGEVKAMVDQALSGDLEAARRSHYQLLPIARGCFLEANPIPVKTALALQGRIREAFRLPLRSMEPENRQKWRAILVSAGLLPEARQPPRHAAE